MILRQSCFAHTLKIGPGRALILHALNHLRLAVDDEALALFAAFETPLATPEETTALANRFGYRVDILSGAIAALYERGFLTERTRREELEAAAATLGEGAGRDPGERLDALRRARREGAADYWGAKGTRTIANLGAARRRIDVALFADCDLQREAEFLSLEGDKRGLDIRVGATFPDDPRWAAERSHDLMLIGALRSRGFIGAAAPGEDAVAPYIEEARRLIEALRAESDKPILIDNLPEPTVQPLGLAERGIEGHRNRYRRANLALAALAEGFADVHVVDVAAALGKAGASRWLDDGLFSFSHFGSPGWLMLRPESEKAAVHGIFPDTAPLVELIEGDPFGRERIVARAHMDAIMTTLGVDQKKCVIVDLDGVLWPGVLAETGSPFAWTPEISGLASFIGLYVGIHEALKTLKRRGIVLAAASKNDEALLRGLWTYPESYPRERLLTPDDFVAWRVNWNDKSANIRELASELGFALNSFIFIDDHPHERERVTRELPEVEAWGEDLFALRRRLLDDPRLQRPRITAEAETRSALVKAQIDREKLRAQTADRDAFLKSIDIREKIARLGADADFSRVEELFQRTTQFNATGRKFASAELSALVARGGAVHAMWVRDRFADHGLVAAAIVEGGEVLGFAMSCRVIGLGVEQRLLTRIVEDAGTSAILARIVETSRNGPVRNLYRDGGFTQREDGAWVKLGVEPSRAA